MLHKLLYLTAVSPVHNGSGQGFGAIDNPIMRQRDTNLPIIQGSSIKGVLRTEWEPDSTRKSILFGPEPKTASSDDNSAHAGALCVGDAQLLFFPVRSLKGAFVWTTSPLTLALYQKQLAFAEIELPSLAHLMKSINGKDLHSTHLLVCPKGQNGLLAGPHVVLEEYGCAPQPCEELAAFAEETADIIFPASCPAFLKDKFKQHLVVLPEDDFQYFITFATEVMPNIRIGEFGATEDGSLRYTEYLLSQSVLCSLWSMDKGRGGKAKDAKMETADSVWAAVKQLAEKNCRVQIGGDATIGKGLIELKFHPDQERN